MDKIKITKAEIAELYDVTDEKEVTSEQPKETIANATFEDYTQMYDEAEYKKKRAEIDG